MAPRKTNSAIEKLLSGGDCLGALAYLRALGPNGDHSSETLLDVLSIAVTAKQADAVRQALDMLKLDTLSQDQTRELAGKLAGAGLHADGLRLLERLDPAEQERFGVLEQKARSLVSAGRLEEAETTYQRINELYPMAGKGWLLSARFYKSQRDVAREADCLFEALKFKLKDLTILKRLALLKTGLQEHRAALEIWQQVARLDPSDREAVVSTLRQLIRLKRFGVAETWAAGHRSLLNADAEGKKLIALLDARSEAMSA